MSQTDAILVDDDIWIREYWIKRMHQYGKKIDVYAKPMDFLDSSKRYAKDIPIFIDYRLKNHSRLGSHFAKVVKNHGYHHIYITSHSLAHEMELPPFISGVIDKQPPEWLLGAQVTIKPLSPQEKERLLLAMNDEQKNIFQKRMNELYERRFGSQDAFIGLSETCDQTTFIFWENAIYQSLPDEMIYTALRTYETLSPP